MSEETAGNTRNNMQNWGECIFDCHISTPCNFSGWCYKVLSHFWLCCLDALLVAVSSEGIGGHGLRKIVVLLQGKFIDLSCAQ